MSETEKILKWNTEVVLEKWSTFEDFNQKWLIDDCNLPHFIRTIILLCLDVTKDAAFFSVQQPLINIRQICQKDVIKMQVRGKDMFYVIETLRTENCPGGNATTWVFVIRRGNNPQWNAPQMSKGEKLQLGRKCLETVVKANPPTPKPSTSKTATSSGIMKLGQPTSFMFKMPVYFLTNMIWKGNVYNLRETVVYILRKIDKGKPIEKTLHNTSDIDTYGSVFQRIKNWTNKEKVRRVFFEQFVQLLNWFVVRWFLSIESSTENSLLF